MSIDDILAESKTLREQLGTVKSLPSAELVKEQISLRKRLRVQMKEQKNFQRKMLAAYREDIAEIRKHMNETEEMIRMLETEMDWNDVDIGEITDVMWNLIRGEKEIPHGRQATDPQLSPSQP